MRSLSEFRLSESYVDNSFIFIAHLATERFKYSMSIPVIGNGIAFTGTGDLFAALFLAHSHGQEDLGAAFEKTIATLQAVLRNTWNRIPEGRLSPDMAIDRNKHRL